MHRHRQWLTSKRRNELRRTCKERKQSTHLRISPSKEIEESSEKEPVISDHLWDVFDQKEQMKNEVHRSSTTAILPLSEHAEGGLSQSQVNTLLSSIELP